MCCSTFIVQLWCKVVRDWAEATGTWAMVPSACPLWENKAIGRRLGPDGQAEVVSALLASGHGHWESPTDAAAFRADAVVTVATTPGRLRITWRTASAVAVTLWEHARANNMFGSVFTVFELHSGDVADGTPFYRMDPYVIFAL